MINYPHYTLLSSTMFNLSNSWNHPHSWNSGHVTSHVSQTVWTGCWHVARVKRWHVSSLGVTVSCFNSHKGSVNRPNLGDTWHLGCGSTSPGMTSMNHVNPHHTTIIYPCGSIDPRSLLLHNSRLWSVPTHLDANPPKIQVSGLSDLAPHILFPPTTKIYFDVRDFNGFHTSWTLGQVTLEYEVSRLQDHLPCTHSSDYPRQFDSLTFGCSACIFQISFWTMLIVSPHVPSIYDQDLLRLAKLRGKSRISISRNTQALG